MGNYRHVGNGSGETRPTCNSSTSGGLGKGIVRLRGAVSRMLQAGVAQGYPLADIMPRPRTGVRDALRKGAAYLPSSSPRMNFSRRARATSSGS